MLVICTPPAVAAPLEQPAASNQIWVDLNPSRNLNPDLDLSGDLGVRWETTRSGWWRFVLRPGVRYRIRSNVFVTGGVGSFYTSNEIIANRWEIRPFQGLLAMWPQWEQTDLEHYLRLEERFDFNTDTWKSRNSLRLRYALALTHKFAARYQEARFWRVRAGGEGFLTVAGDEGQFREEVRASLAVDRSLRRDMVLRFEATWQQEGLFFDSSKSVDVIYFRFRLFYGLGQLLRVY